MKQGGVYLILLAIFFGEFFCTPKAEAVELPKVQINEVAWMGTLVSYAKEWVEIKNNSDESVDLKDWTLNVSSIASPIVLSGVIPVKGFYLLERTSDESVPNVPMDQRYAGDLANSGALLELKDSAGNLIDRVEASAKWPAGNNTTKVTMERDAAGNWLDSLAVGGTPKQENSVYVITVPVDESQQTSSFNSAEAPLDTATLSIEGGGVTSSAVNSEPIVLPNKITPQAGEVVINEIVSDPNDGDEEWVEIYLNSSREFDLTNWSIEDGSKTKTILQGKLNASNRFLVIEKPKGALNNAGDLIILRDDKGVMLDQLTYGNWNGESGLEAPRDGKSLARLFDGVTSFNNASDFAISETPTKNGANKIVGPVNSDTVIGKPTNYKDLVISELMPNPQGNDSAEWLEISNRGKSNIDLKDWRIGMGDKYFKFASGTIVAGEYLVIGRNQSKLALPNTGGTVKLYPPSTPSASQSVHYSDVHEGQSYAQDIDGTWAWTLVSTPGNRNQIKKTNEAPQVAVYFETPVEQGQLVLFDSSDTVDMDGDGLSYWWQFGDGATSSLANPQHAYQKSGSYHIKLQVSDGWHKVSEEKNIKVNKSTLSISQKAYSIQNSQVIINELMANPSGADDEEWVEVFNKGKAKVNLLGWQLDDEEGGSSPFKIEEDVWVEPQGFVIFERAETSIALNNDHDEVRLFDPSGKLADQVGYQKAADDLAFARNANGEWQWTSIPTPGETNVINYTPEGKRGKVKGKSAKAAIGNKSSNLIKITGVVTSLPGGLSSQFFYIQNADGGYQVYSYKKDFPSLSLGDLVEVAGEQSEINSEVRLKTNKAENIKVLKAGQLVNSQSLSCENISENYLSQLITLKGEVTKKSGASVYLDDGTDEAVVYLKQSTGLKVADLKLGERYDVTGILTKTKTGFRLLPRSETDIVAEKLTKNPQGEVATNSSEVLSARSPYEKQIAYASVIGGGGLILGAGWLMRKKMGL